MEMTEDPDVGMKKPNHHTMPTQWKWLQSGWVRISAACPVCVRQECSASMRLMRFR